MGKRRPIQALGFHHRKPSQGRELAREKIDKINTTRYDGNLIKLQTKQVKCYKFDDIIEMKI